MKYRLLLLVVIMTSVLCSCGVGTVDVSNDSYEPRIVIDGLLQPGLNVDKIRITRNFPVGTDLTHYNLVPDPRYTTVLITDLENNNTYRLTFHGSQRVDSCFYYYNGSTLVIDYNKSYLLEVYTRIDGKDLYARAVTTTPQSGFSIESINYPELNYYQLDPNGDPLNFEITINRSPETTFYIFTYLSLEASKANFIYDNPFMDFKPEDVEENLNDLKFEWEWIQNTPSYAGSTIYKIQWFDLSFYGEYQVVAYAADKNFREFLQTYDFVQEEDGNFHEAKFNIEGDGIGYFGSVIADTVHIKVTQ